MLHASALTKVHSDSGERSRYFSPGTGAFDRSDPVASSCKNYLEWLRAEFIHNRRIARWGSSGQLLAVEVERRLPFPTR